eukprot:403332816
MESQKSRKISSCSTAQSDFNSCFVCYESFDKELLISTKLRPCKHKLCRDCLKKWRAKGGEKCPLCQQQITHYIRKDRHGMRVKKRYTPSQVKMQKIDEELQREALEAIDHSFMTEVIEGLLHKRNEVYKKKFESRTANGTSQEYDEIEIFTRFIYNVQAQIQRFENFDAYDKLTKIYAINDRLLQIQSDQPQIISWKQNQTLLESLGYSGEQTSKNEDQQVTLQISEIPFNEVRQKKRGKKGGRILIVSGASSL